MAVSTGHVWCMKRTGMFARAGVFLNLLLTAAVPPNPFILQRGIGYTVAIRNSIQKI